MYHIYTHVYVCMCIYIYIYTYDMCYQLCNKSMCQKLASLTLQLVFMLFLVV